MQREILAFRVRASTTELKEQKINFGQGNLGYLLT